MTGTNFRVTSFILGLTLLLSILQYGSTVDVDCNFDLKVSPKMPIKMSNYGWKRNRLLTNCQWRIYSDTGVKLKCRRKARLPQSMKPCKFEFNVYPDGMKSEPIKKCGESHWYQSNRNVMTVTLRGPANIPEDTFDCHFEATRDCRCGWKNPSKIIGGKAAKVNEYPMVAAIISKYGKIAFPVSKEEVLCGATIISSQFLLAAAHCINKKVDARLGVLTGDHDLETYHDTRSSQLFRVASKKVHESYNPKTRYNDIGLIKVQGFIEFTNTVGPACLPFNRQFIFERAPVEVFGWGLTALAGTNSAVLKKAPMKITTVDFCRRYNPDLASSQICTYDDYNDACQNDSGGPILWRDPTTRGQFLIGVISYGNSCANRQPGYNTRVTSYLKWIENNTPGVNHCRVAAL